MVRIFRHYVSPIKLTLAAIDFFLVFGCAVGAELLRYSLAGLPVEISSDIADWAAKILLPLIALPVLLGVGVYQSEALADFRVFWIRLVVGLVVAGMVSAAILYLFPIFTVWRSTMVLAISLSAGALMMSHGIFARFGSPQVLGKRVLLLGAGRSAAQMMHYAMGAREAGLNIVHSVALPGETVQVENVVRMEDINTLDAFLADNQIEMVIVTRDNEATPLPLEALLAAKLSGVEVKDRLSCYEQIRGYVDIASVGAEWLVFSEGFRGSGAVERGAKRTLDLLVSLAIVVLASPILLMAGLLVKLTSKGPVFYHQERVGLHGRPFNLFKFRSMRVDAEKEGQPQWAAERDPRITWIGNFLRKTRIDELPQILNVFKGDMSFVGPRPERPFFVDQLEKDIPFYRERHCVKPGITGWAQIRYPYGASVEDARRKLEYDLYYIKNYSLFLDLLIIIQTVRVVLFPSGVR